ncbi:MAG: response regulator [Thermosynechococcaceae cyanobacterium]
MVASSITVFIVESCAIARQRLTDLLSGTSEIQVIGTANDGIAALEQIPQLQPDVICTNLQMPKMDGFELIRQLLAACPRPILVVSPTVQPTETETIAKAFNAGAIDVFLQPLTGRWQTGDQQALTAKIKILAGVRVFTKPLRSSVATALPPPLPTVKMRADTTQILALGASTGGHRPFTKSLVISPLIFPCRFSVLSTFPPVFCQG